MALPGPRTLILDLVVEGEPVPQGRVRVTRQGTYMPAKTRHATHAIGWEMKERVAVPTEDLVVVEATFFLGNRRKCDLDNLWKLVSDAGNKIVWIDDAQIIEVLMRKWVDKDRPRTELRVWKANVNGN